MLIGLYGKARSGKTTVAEHLENNYGFSSISFATPIKKMIREFFFMTEEQTDGKLKEKIDLRYGMSPRKLMQYLGTDVFRNIYPNIWADLAMKSYRNHCLRNKMSGNPQPWIVVSDVRFKNEKEAIEKEGGVVWKIVREENPGASTGFEGHPSECDLDAVPDSDYAAVLVAWSGDIGGLCKAAEGAYSMLLKEKR